MRAFILSFFLLLALLAGGIFFIAVPMIKTEIITTLEDRNFKNVALSGFQFSPTGLGLKKITANNFEIDGFKAKFYWPTYFFEKSVDFITIDRVRYKFPPESKNTGFLYKNSNSFKKANLSETPETEIKSIIIEVSPEIIFSGYLDKNKHQISGTLDANSPLIKLNSKWIISEDDNLFKKFLINVDDINIKNKSFSLNRGNGWLSYEFGTENTVNAQIESGSGSLFNLPLNNISFIIGDDQNIHSLLFRAIASGYPNISIASDIEWKENFKIKNFISNISFPSSNQVKEYLVANNIFENKKIKNFPQLDQTKIKFSYLPERRFAEGPLPFQTTIIENGKDHLAGTVLIYPENFDLRGTLSGDKEIIRLINNSLPIKMFKISENSLRLDGKIGTSNSPD